MAAVFESAPAASAAESRVEPAARPDDEVICPRCQLHFYPRGKQSAPTATKRYTVLVIEDQEYFRQTAADALESAYDVKTTAGAAEAREILALGGIDLLVLDLTLGGGNEGEQFLLVRKRRGPGLHGSHRRGRAPRTRRAPGPGGPETYG